jgi:hypothetical protein
MAQSGRLIGGPLGHLKSWTGHWHSTVIVGQPNPILFELFKLANLVKSKTILVGLQKLPNFAWL